MARSRALALCLILFARAALGAVSIDIDLTAQRAQLIVDGEVVESAPISSGDADHPTPAGNFKVLAKELNHFSTLYGRIVTPAGRVLRADATPSDPIPAGARFVPSPMRWFIGFAEGCGLHAGTLPGYPASHGCVRLPAEKARAFFDRVQIGDAVRIHGRAPKRGTPTPR